MAFPNVPNVPGVPALLRDPAAAAQSAITLLTGDTFAGYGSGLTPVWGVYLDGVPAVVADTIGSFAFKREWAIADYPVERGGFESYDKVDIPYDARVQFVAGGSEANRQLLLDSLDAIAGDLKLYDVVTPERIYPSVNVQHYDYRRTARNGLGLLLVEVWLLEVRVEGVADGLNTKDPSSSGPVSNGYVQPSTNAAPTTGSVQAFAGSTVSPSPSTFSIVPTGNTAFTQGNLLPVQ